MMVQCPATFGQAAVASPFDILIRNGHRWTSGDAGLRRDISLKAFVIAKRDLEVGNAVVAKQ